jgi:DNA-binding transcriptional MerR regulator
VAVMEGDGYRIGELARLSGLSVKTIRFYSDRGLVPPARRTGAGYRVYDERALARLELIRALRELGASLADVERVLTRELDVAGLVALQLEAVEAQLRVLRVRRAVLMAVASGEPDGLELRTMTRLAHISDDERKRIVEDFLDEVLGGLEIDPGLEARLRGGLPELPDDPTPEQVEAWVERPSWSATRTSGLESVRWRRPGRPSGRRATPRMERRYARQRPWWPSAEEPPWRRASSRALRRPRRSWRRSSGRSQRKRT